MKYSKDVYDHFIMEEGFRTKAYLDHQGNYTIGVGHLLGRNPKYKGMVWSEEKVMSVLDDDIDIALGHAKTIFPQFDIIPPKVQLGILDMIFNLGGRGFREFKKMIRMINLQKYQEAAKEALDSEWAREDVPNRARRTAKLISNED